MDLVAVMRDSVKTLWRHKHYWLFGIFVAGTGNGGNSGEGGAGAAPGAFGLGAVGDVWPAMPGWAWPLLAVAALVAVAAVVMHLVSEGALIEGVARSRKGGALSVREGFRVGWAHAGVVFRVKALVLLLVLPFAAALGLPAILHGLGLLSGLAAGVLAVPAVLIGVPFAVTVYVLYSFALRIAVLENRHAMDALRRARLFLHRRLLVGLKLILANALGGVGMGIAMALVMIPAAPFAGLGYLAADWVGAAVAGGVVAMPLLIAVMGAHGTFQSSVWTLGFLAAAEETV